MSGSRSFPRSRDGDRVDPRRFRTRRSFGSLEGLETRTLCADISTFARFSEVLVAPDLSRPIVIQVDPTDFTVGARGRVALRFVARPIGAGAVTTLSLIGPAGSTLLKAGKAATPARARIAAGELTFGSAQVLLQGTPGTYEVVAGLMGDANGDFRVDSRDVRRITQANGRKVGKAGYSEAADVNLDGRINRADADLARRNLGASTRIRPLTLAAGLTSDSDPDGDRVVDRADITVSARTLLGATVQLDVGANGSIERTVAAPAGSAALTVQLDVGTTILRVRASERFGQKVVVDLAVTRVPDSDGNPTDPPPPPPTPPPPPPPPSPPPPPPPPPPTPSANLTGSWTLKGTDLDGSVWLADLSIQQGVGEGNIVPLSGHFDWQDTGFGRYGREYFTGTFDRAQRTFNVTGNLLENAFGIAKSTYTAKVDTATRSIFDGVWGGGQVVPSNDWDASRTRLSESDFSAGLDGWQVTAATASIALRTSGGDPAGYLSVNDQGAGGQSRLFAPTKFQGAWSSVGATPGLVSVDVQLVEGGPVSQALTVRISGPGGAASFMVPANGEVLLGQWRTLLVPLDPAAWTVTSGTWTGLLNQVTTFSLAADVTDTTEVLGFDNVRVLIPDAASGRGRAAMPIHVSSNPTAPGPIEPILILDSGLGPWAAVNKRGVGSRTLTGRTSLQNP